MSHPRRGPDGRRRTGGRLDALANQAFLIPIGLVLVTLVLYPLGRTVYFSLTNFSGYSTDVSFVGLRNYANLLSNPSMRAGLFFTVVYAVATTVVVTVLAVPLAVVLNQRFVGRGFVRSVLFFPSVLSVAVLGLVWGFLLSPLASGMVNSVLGSVVGLAPVPWLSHSELAQLSVVVVGVWVHTGWHAVLYLAYLQSIPHDYYEAATIDGASSVQQFFSITLPLLAPAMSVSTLLLITGGLKVYDLPFTLTGGGPGYSTYTVTQSIIQSGISQGKVGQASALSIVFMAAVVVVVAAQLAITRRADEADR